MIEGEEQRREMKRERDSPGRREREIERVQKCRKRERLNREKKNKEVEVCNKKEKDGGRKDEEYMGSESSEIYKKRERLRCGRKMNG